MAASAIETEKSTTTAQGGTVGLEDAAHLQDGDEDIAMGVVGEHRHAIDPAVEARVVRKIDLFLVPAMFIGYGLVYYDKVGGTIKKKAVANYPGDPRICRPLRNDQRPRPEQSPPHDPAFPRYLPPELGNVDVLLRDAGRFISYDVRAAEVRYGTDNWERGLRLGGGVHVHRGGDRLARALRAAVLLGICRERHPDRLHVHHQLVLHAKGAGVAAELVVLRYGAVYHHWRGTELRVRADPGWCAEAVAVHLPARRISDLYIRYLLLLHTELAGFCMVPEAR